MGAGLRSEVKESDVVMRSVRKEWGRVINGTYYTFVMRYDEYESAKSNHWNYTVYTTSNSQMFIHRYLRILP